jgi:rhodanese-related sulfurtransferase
MKEIKANDLKEKLDKNEVLLIDVREPHEYKAASIEGAHLIPLGDISLDKLPSQSLPIVIHCRSGKRSKEACTKLLEMNKNLVLYSLEGGIQAWQDAGFPVQSSEKKNLSLERQTQITAGLFCFLGTGLGFLLNPYFYIIPGFVGLGLLVSGITGWCGTTTLLSKMPWNR